MIAHEEYAALSAIDLNTLYRKRILSPVGVVTAALERIDRLNSGLNAFVLVAAERALDEARAAESRFASGEICGPLEGVPVSVKDNIFTAGLRSTSGSPLFRDFVPDADSGVVAAIRRAGAIVVGKTNTPAFGWTSTTDNMLFGPTRNPWNTALTCGGSSGGGAVAAATGMVPLSIGTDGGGSLRTPGAFTGTVGFKPSHGRLPDTPAHPHWLLQHYGPLTRSVRDAAFLLDATAGPDPLDPHSLPRHERPYLDDIDTLPKPPRALFTTQLGWVKTVDPQIVAACSEVTDDLAATGWTVERRDLDWEDPAPFANVLSIVGFQHRLAAFRHREDEIEGGIRAMLDAAAALPPNAFYDAYLERNRWCAQPFELFERFDLLLTPTTATLPFPVGQLSPSDIAGVQVPPGAWNPYLRAFNLTGQPAITVPVGRSREGFPIGLQIVGPKHGDRLLLAAAAAVERLRPWQAWQPS